MSGRLVGVFSRSSDGSVEFAYGAEAPATPLSLSLPHDGPIKKGAAETYLSNLLPDHDSNRAALAQIYGTSAELFDLLGAVGEDVAGAVTLTPDDHLPERVPAALVEITPDEFAARIAALHRNPEVWVDPRVKPRMSLAGTQPKFSVTNVGRRQFWSTYEVPSTHIVKVPTDKIPHVEKLEAASLRLARELGVPAAPAEAIDVLGQKAFVVQRWDRSDGTRLHAEDLSQSLARPAAAKYDVTAPQIARVLAPHGEAMPFVRQLAFNVAVGNADAHAKNYSVLLAGDQVRLAPLYDVVPVVAYAQYDTTYAMPIGRARRAHELSERAWRTFAHDAGLDPDEVCHTALPIVRGVADRIESGMAATGIDTHRLRRIQAQARSLRRLDRHRSTRRKEGT